MTIASKLLRVLDTRSDDFEQGFARPLRRLGAHQDPDFFERLPLPVERQERPDFKVAGRDVERLRDARPFLEIAEPGPARDTVVDNE